MRSKTWPRLRGRNVLVYFYPRADTPGCTQQACGLRDIAGQIGDTVIVGISPDKPAALARFRDKYSLNFDLLSDLDHVGGRGVRGVEGEEELRQDVHGHRALGVLGRPRRGDPPCLVQDQPEGHADPASGSTRRMTRPAAAGRCVAASSTVPVRRRDRGARARRQCHGSVATDAVTSGSSPVTFPVGQRCPVC